MNTKKRSFSITIFEIIFFNLLMVVSVVKADTVLKASTVDPLVITQVPGLQAQSLSQNKFMPRVMPSGTNLLGPGNYPNGNPYASSDNDLELYDDGDGGYVAEVNTVKGFLEAIYDPANPSWPMNSNDPDGWKKNSSLRYQFNVTYPSGVSKIHKIILEKNINMNDVDGVTARSYGVDVYNPGTTNTSDGNNSIDNNGNVTAGYGDYEDVHMRHDQLDIDGQKQYWVNMGYNNLALRGQSGTEYKEDWTIENIKCIYGTTYWGMVSCNTGKATNYITAHLKPDDPEYDKTKVDRAKQGLDGGYTWITYRNIRYIGSQLSWTQRGTSGSTIAGNVVSSSVRSYRDPVHPEWIWLTESNGTQQIFQEDQMIFEKDCNFMGSTYNSNGLEMTGSVQLRDGANVNIHPHGWSGENYSNMNYGIFFTSDASNEHANLKLYGSAKLNIYCDGEDGNDPIGADGKYDISQHIKPEEDRRTLFKEKPAGAFKMADPQSNLEYIRVPNETYSPEINIVSDGQIYNNYPLVDMAGGTANLSHGSFSIKAKNLGKYSNAGGSGGLMSVGSGMNINVRTGGSFNISVADTNNSEIEPINLLYSAGQMNIKIKNPDNVTLDLVNDQCPNSALVYVRTGGSQTTLNTIQSVINKDIWNNLAKQVGDKIPKEALDNPSNVLLATGSGGNVEVYNTKVVAYGDNSKINDSSLRDKDGNYIKTNGENVGVSSTPRPTFDEHYKDQAPTSVGQNYDAAKGPIGPVRVQHLTLPFYHNLLAPMLYVIGRADIQAPDEESLQPLRNAMLQMLGKEFRHIELSDLPGPGLDIPLLDSNGNVVQDAQNNVMKKTNFYPDDNILNGFVNNNSWSKTSSADEGLKNKKVTPFLPETPYVRVQIRHPKDSTKANSTNPKDYDYTDLGTVTNNLASDAVVMKNYPEVTLFPLPAIDANSKIVTNKVTPSQLMINNNDELDFLTDTSETKTLKHKPSINDNILTNGGIMIGSAVTTANSNSINPRDIIKNNKTSESQVAAPKYVKDTYLQWGQSTAADDSDIFSLKIRDLIDDYNMQHPNSKIHLKSTDTILLNSVTNFQASPTQELRVVNLALQPAKSHSYLLGEPISVPVNYQEGDTDAKYVHVSGVVDPDDKNKIITTDGDLKIPDDGYNKLITDTSWQITGATKTVGKHTLKISANDYSSPTNQQAINTADPIEWHYEVIDLPSYKSVLKVSDNPYGDGISNGSKILSGYHKLVSTFTPRDTTKPVHSFTFKHDASSDSGNNSGGNWDLVGDVEIQAISDKDTRTISVDSLNTNKIYTPDIFNQGTGTGDLSDGRGNFKPGIKFVITRKINVHKNSSLTAPVTIGADTITSIDYLDNVQDLGTTNELKYGFIGSIELRVPKKIVFKSQIVPAKGAINIDKSHSIEADGLSIINKIQDNNPNNPNNDAKFSLIAEIASTNDKNNDPDFFNKYLKYKTANKTYDFGPGPAQILQDLVIHGINTNNLDNNYTETWFNQNGKQVSGPILDIPSNSAVKQPGKHTANITWTLTFGP
ncbi:hypothetical protein [Bombilactobacillus bombi]|uniref:hypothetical protein n=1 Tax=Bombilactobacillus bombi TaxID=1303590 RepID=UPI0015E5B7DA|nr:hypothetical protein [Bombilactobacillus bombi]MBA1434501.1 hypothetical protein [Bombilactobacillus bombi]